MVSKCNLARADADINQTQPFSKTVVLVVNSLMRHTLHYTSGTCSCKASTVILFQKGNEYSTEPQLGKHVHYLLYTDMGPSTCH